MVSSLERPQQDEASPPLWLPEVNQLVLGALFGAVIVAGVEWLLLVLQARELFPTAGQVAVMLPLCFGNLLPYTFAASLVLLLADLAARRLSSRIRLARPLVAAGVAALSLPYAVWLARFTFSGPRARELALVSLLVAATTVAIASATGAAVWFGVARRTWRRWPLAVIAVSVAATASALWLSRAVLPDEYEPLHAYLGLCSVTLSVLGGRELAAIGWSRIKSRAGSTLIAASALTLLCAIAAGAILARAHGYAWILWGETAASRYVTQRWMFLGPKPVAASDGAGMSVKPSLETPLTAEWRKRRAREQAPNIIVFSIDGLRQDHVGAYGYQTHPTTPNIDRFARRGVRFTNAFTSYPMTQVFNSALLLGRYVPSFAQDQLPFGYRDKAITNLLDARSYHTFVKSWFEHSSSDTFQPAEFKVDTNVSKGRGRKHVESAPDQVLERLATHLDEAATRREPVFAWMHFLATHPVPRKGFVAHPDFPFGDTSSARYDSAIAGTDRLLGLIEDLVAKRLGTDRPTYWFICADHGVNIIRRSRDLFDGVARVPLVAVGPGIKPGVDASLIDVSLDLASTIVDLAGIEPPAVYDGVSLIPVLMRMPTEALATRVVPLSYKQWTGGVYRQFKYVKRQRTVSLFDLTADPQEKRNLVGEQGNLLTQISGVAEAELARRIELARQARQSSAPDGEASEEDDDDE